MACVLVGMDKILVKTGSEARAYCNTCELEWELLLEPNQTGMDYETAKANGAGVRTISFCPFCGGSDIAET